MAGGGTNGRRSAGRDPSTGMNSQGGSKQDVLWGCWGDSMRKWENLRTGVFVYLRRITASEGIRWEGTGSVVS